MAKMSARRSFPAVEREVVVQKEKPRCPGHSEGLAAHGGLNQGNLRGVHGTLGQFDVRSRYTFRPNVPEYC